MNELTVEELEAFLLAVEHADLHTILTDGEQMSWLAQGGSVRIEAGNRQFFVTLKIEER